MYVCMCVCASAVSIIMSLHIFSICVKLNRRKMFLIRWIDQHPPYVKKST